MGQNQRKMKNENGMKSSFSSDFGHKISLKSPNVQLFKISSRQAALTVDMC